MVVVDRSAPAMGVRATFTRRAVLRKDACSRTGRQLANDHPHEDQALKTVSKCTAESPFQWARAQGERFSQ